MKNRNYIENKIVDLEGKIEREVNLAYRFKNDIEKESRIDDLLCERLALIEQLEKAQ